jgi:hypothetical protein
MPRVVRYNFTDVSEALAASIIRSKLPLSPHVFPNHKMNIDIFIAVNITVLKMEAASTSETSVSFYQTTRRNNPEDSHLHSLKICENV